MQESIQDLTDQEVEIVKLILNFGVIHYSDISKHIGRSRKTISKYLDNIQDVIQIYDVKLTRKRNVGIYFEGSTSGLQNAMQSGTYSSTKSNSDERVISILSRLLLSGKPQTIQDLADSAFVSRSTLEKDFKQVKRMLAKFGATITTNHEGMIVEATENSKRKLMSQLLTMYWGETAYSEDKKGEMHRQIDIPSAMKPFFSKATFDNVLKSLKEFEKQSAIHFTDYEFQSLAIHLVVSIERIRKDKTLTENGPEVTLEADTKKLVSILESNFKFSIPIDECQYINIHILAAEGQPIGNDKLKKASSPIQKNNIHEFLVESLANYDEILLRGLTVHLASGLKRLSLGLSLYNPYTADIKTFFPFAFNTAMDLGTKIENTFGIKLNDDEIAFMALHIEAFIERKKDVVDAVVVCSTGLGTARLLEQRLREFFSDTIHISRITSIQDLIKKPISEDLVISTINIEIPDKPVVVVSPFLDEKSTGRIRKISNQVLSERQDSNSFGKLLSKKLIFINHGTETKQAVINKIGNELVKQGFGQKGISLAAMKREKMASTAMNNIAMPHAPIEFVIHPCIAVYVNLDGISWGDNQVNIVFFLAMNREIQPEIEQIYKHFNSVLENKRLIKKLVNSKRENEILNLLRGDLIE
ncbi:BglG family transcription antiterminator [Pediococcus inopinatus]|uniref:BglG family transcription antiterminator n=1 Tax=Pediococcus inopinatus TaxID=114090 RepID=A0ABZ0Q6F2_9LACO|nr:BglG family transcription antiterminator [Pediococcus inopinatus]WPC16649.1 BglG family transcription antiterminator [Pediococcus inopinatus]WPC20229.1 BglG family transcription antiterminator [Pediococcus inopinatus]WPC21934.1 BglG family transcription antiterminator [Pediococcus inopinatus]WPP09135.1 BglG family transcription antiterminator [Pediococcus inopinatus]